MIMNVLNAVAQFSLLIKHIQSGLRQAKSEGKILGRPPRHSAKNISKACVTILEKK